MEEEGRRQRGAAMMWLKYSDQPIQFVDFEDRKQSGRILSYEKPNGCWITDDSEDCWKSWCIREDFGLSGLSHVHDVVLDETNICFLKSPFDLDRFTEEFKAFHIWGPPDQPRKYRDLCIDWTKVAERYDGLVITPYQWQRRIYDSYSWYYTWDCASGCIWKATAIKDIRLIDVYRPAASSTAIPGKTAG